MKKKILIIDDEKIARDRIKRFLSSSSPQSEIFEAENAIEGLTHINQLQPDVVFLDIQMPVMNGFEMLTHLENRNFRLIFQTAYDEFAVKAFEENACDYLLKPFDEERLKKALSKAFDLDEQSKKLSILEKKLDASLTTFISKSGSTRKIIKLDDILAFKSEDHYTFAITDSSEHIIENSLNWIESKLDPEKFIRSHRNNIVKIASIEKIGGVQDSQIILKNDVSLPLSREARKEFKKRNLI
ncbi:MAG: LytR/AlgR family response regulator transcription factor [Pseudobdellovibrio sp.]